MPNPTVEFSDVQTARARIKEFVKRTPVITCATLDRMAGRRLFFKCENLQKVGAFKFRGACNAVMKLADRVAAQGVLTHSSGNHAQALALAARLRGIAAHIVMPNNAPKVKQRAVDDYGARIILCEPTLESRESTAAAVQSETGGTLIHPYDQLDIIAGQGTVALELMEQVDNLDAIVAPVGGGGLVSGICIAAKALNPKIRIFAAEPIGADDAARSFAAGQRIPQSSPKTIADGLLTSLGELTWPIIRENVEQVITVSDQEIISAMRLMWERAKSVIEPSGAVAVAAILSDKFKALHGLERVAIVLSGGNVDLEQLPW